MARGGGRERTNNMFVWGGRGGPQTINDKDCLNRVQGRSLIARCSPRIDRKQPQVMEAYLLACKLVKGRAGARLLISWHPYKRKG